MPLRILITGSSGEIGTNLALRLLAEGHEVFGVDRRPNTWTDAFPYVLQDLSGRFTTYAGGIGSQRYPERLDAVVHLAANAKVHQLVAEPWRALDNVTVTFNVLEFCRAQALPIIFASSREVYGDVKRFATSEEQTHVSFTESTYSASKISGEAFVYAYAKCYGIPYIAFRFSNVFGRYDNDVERMERVIPLFIRRIAAGEGITVFGKEKMLDFTYVDDCVDGIVRGLERLVRGAVRNETINLAYGEGHTLGEVVECIGEAVGVAPQATYASSLVGEVTHYIADITKAKALLGYAPQVPLAEGIRRAVAWQKDWAAGKGVPVATSAGAGKAMASERRLGILFVSAFYPPYRGGAEVFAEEAACRLALRGHEVTVLTARLSRTLPAEERSNGVRIVRVGLGTRADKFLFPLLAPLRMLGMHYDVAYGVLESYAGLAVAFAKLLTHRPTVLTVQSGTLDDWRRGFGLNVLLRRFIHRTPDAIHAISAHLAARARFLGAHRTVVIPNGVDLQRAMAHGVRDPYAIVCLGRLYPVKGQDVLLRAFPAVLAAHPKATLHFVGDGPERARLEALAGELGITGRVEFRGDVPHADVPRVLASAAVVVGPSRAEGQGIAFVEAQAAGAPVVASAVGGIPDIVEDGVTGVLVPPEDPAALARAIVSVLNDPAKAARMTEIARARALRYDWDRIITDVEHLLASLVTP